VVEVAPRRGAPGSDRRGQRTPVASPASAPSGKVKPSILSTIKSKPKTVRK